MQSAYYVADTVLRAFLNKWTYLISSFEVVVRPGRDSERVLSSPTAKSMIDQGPQLLGSDPSSALGRGLAPHRLLLPATEHIRCTEAGTFLGDTGLL